MDLCQLFFCIKNTKDFSLDKEYKNPWTALANHVHKEDKMKISINLLIRREIKKEEISSFIFIMIFL